MFAHLNKITSGQETTNRQKREKFLLKRMMSDFPQSGVQLGERNALNISLPNDNIHLPEKNWQLPFFNVVKLNFYDVATLSLPFQITSCSGEGWHPWNCKQCEKPFLVFVHEVSDQICVSKKFLSGWFSFSKCVEIFHSKLDSISNPLPLHEVKSNEG